MRLLLILLTFNIYALELSDLALEYNHAVMTNRSPILDKDETKRGELNLEMKIKTTKYTYQDIRVLSTIGKNQFRHVALDTESGIRYNEIDLYYKHKSQHSLDAQVYENGYPNENSVGLRIRLK